MFKERLPRCVYAMFSRRRRCPPAISHICSVYDSICALIRCMYVLPKLCLSRQGTRVRRHCHPNSPQIGKMLNSEQADEDEREILLQLNALPSEVTRHLQNQRRRITEEVCHLRQDLDRQVQLNKKLMEEITEPAVVSSYQVCLRAFAADMSPASSK